MTPIRARNAPSKAACDWSVGATLRPAKCPYRHVALGESAANALSACPPVRELVGHTEQSAIDMLDEVGWPHRTIYRDEPLEYEENENKVASRVTLIVVGGKIVDARWI